MKKMQPNLLNALKAQESGIKRMMSEINYLETIPHPAKYTLDNVLDTLNAVRNVYIGSRKAWNRESDRS